jgi:hypothetical protein
MGGQRPSKKNDRDVTVVQHLLNLSSGICQIPYNRALGKDIHKEMFYWHHYYTSIQRMCGGTYWPISAAGFYGLQGLGTEEAASSEREQEKK